MLPTIYLINLDRDTDRLREFMGANGSLGLQIIRVPAILGKDIQVPPVDLEGYRRINAGGGPPKPAEVGCYLSHIKAMEYFLKNSEPWCIIMEDDANLEPGSLTVLRSLGESKAWDVAKLFYFHHGFPLRMQPLGENHHLTLHLSRTTSCAAYAITREAALKLTTHLLPIKEPVDHALDQGWDSNLRIRALYPRLADLLPSATQSTIGYGVRKRQPMPAYAWVQLRKGIREIRRLFHGLKSYLLNT